MDAERKHVLFICYSHADSRIKSHFDKFLKVAAATTNMEVRSDADIAPGEEWQHKIADALRDATATLMLVSQDFMVSPFIQQVELRELLAAHFRRGLRLFLVPVRSTFYQGTYLERFQWARPPDKPLSSLPEQEQERAMVDVCRLIASTLSVPPDDASIQRAINCLESIPKLDLPAIYELAGAVGEGEFARCYLARDRLLDRNVVIKVLREELSRDSPAYDRYIRSSSRLQHRNIVGVLFTQTNKLPHFIVMPAVGGQTMAEKLAAERPTVEQAVGWIAALADALHYAHAHGCVHGKLRPCEVRFDADGQPMLAGFRTLDRGPLQVACADKMTIDDFWYASPETRASGLIDQKSDQYLLGMLAYEAIAGRPVALSSWASLLDPALARAIEHPQPLGELVPDCDAHVSDAIMRALSPDPARRWENLRAFAVAFGPAARRSCFETAKESYRRCAQDPAFYRAVYDHLFAVIPEVEGMFKNPERQRDVLRDAIWLLLTYPDTNETTEPTILSSVARTHGWVTREMYDQFRDAILATVAERDPPEPVAAWRDAMKPGFDYLERQLPKRTAAEPQPASVRARSKPARPARAR